MAKKKDADINKTNAMRLLEQAGIAFRIETYEFDEEHLSGEHVASQVSLPADQIFKTLVVRGDKQGIMVFCIPVTMELDLKKAAKAVMDALKVSKALVVVDDNNNVVLSARNIPDVKTASTSTINVYDILKYDTLVVTQDAVATIQEVYA